MMQNKVQSDIIRLPENFTEYSGEEIMSNFDGLVIEETEVAIKGERFFSRYSGWNFNGLVWWQEGKWHCEVWRYGSWGETISENTLEEIMSSVSDKYGRQ